jgi:hypothetical protein
MVRARRGSGKRVTEVALTRGGEDGAGTAAMLPVAACSGAGSWMRRQRGCDRAQPRSRRRENGELEKGGGSDGRRLLKQRRGEVGEGVPVGASMWRMEMEGEKGALMRWSASRVAPLSHEQGKAAGVDDADEGARAADARCRGEVGDPVSAVGCGGERKREVGRRWGNDRRAWVARFKPGLKQILNSNVSNKSQIASNFGRLEKYFPWLRKIEIKYSFEGLEEMNNFLHGHFLIFGMGLELKFREVSMS